MIKLELSKQSGKFTDEDLHAHDSVAGVFKVIKRGKEAKTVYLVQDHVKHNMLTFPVGKVKFDQTIEEALKAEMNEELGVKLTKYTELFSFDFTYDFDGKKVPIRTHVFDIITYSGTIKNKEPAKCKGLFWMTREELEKSHRKLGTNIVHYFKYLDEHAKKKGGSK